MRVISATLDLMFDQMLNNLIVCLISKKKYIRKLHKRGRMLQWIQGGFDVMQNELEMRLA